MLNPKELFRFNATTREKKPSTTRGRTPIDTYPPTVIPAVADRVLAPDIAPPPTKEEARAANAGEFAGETRVVKKVGGNKALKVVLAGGAVVAGGAVAYENVPAFHQAVDSAFLDHIKGKSLSSETSTNTEVFDPTAREGVIKTIKTISEEETAKLDSFAKIDDHNTVLAIYPIDISTSNKPDAKIKYIRVLNQEGANLADQGYLDFFRFEKVPEGSTILAPEDGRLFLIILRRQDTEDDHPFHDARIEFQPREGEVFRMRIVGSSTKGGGMMNPPRSDVFRSLTNAPVYESTPAKNDTSILEVMKQAIPVKKGQPILQAAMEIDVDLSLDGNIDLSRTKGKITVNGEERNLLMPPDPTNLKLFLSKDGEIIQPQKPNN